MLFISPCNSKVFFATFLTNWFPLLFYTNPKIGIYCFAKTLFPFLAINVSIANEGWTNVLSPFVLHLHTTFLLLYTSHWCLKSVICTQICFQLINNPTPQSFLSLVLGVNGRHNIRMMAFTHIFNPLSATFLFTMMDVLKAFTDPLSALTRITFSCVYVIEFRRSISVNSVESSF